MPIMCKSNQTSEASSGRHFQVPASLAAAACALYPVCLSGLQLQRSRQRMYESREDSGLTFAASASWTVLSASISNVAMMSTARQDARPTPAGGAANCGAPSARLTMRVQEPQTLTAGPICWRHSAKKDLMSSALWNWNVLSNSPLQAWL